MTKELEQELVENYPDLLRDFRDDSTKTALAWGCECDDGWFVPINKALNLIKWAVKDRSEYGYDVKVAQIKEKFGELRIYLHFIDADNMPQEVGDIISCIVRLAEQEASNTCEVSGAIGLLCKRGSWYKTISYEVSRDNGYEPVDEETRERWKERDETQ